MKKFTFGTPETLVPSRFCAKFSYTETPVSFTAENFSFHSDKRGCVVEFAMAPDTQVFGLGLQLKSFNHTGKQMTMRVNADPVTPCGESHAPVPFFVTNKGYGMYFDTARYAQFYCGARHPGGAVDNVNLPATNTDDLYAVRKATDESLMSVHIPVAEGVDVYVIEGDTISDIVAQYNRLAGGAPEVPEWSLGTMYRCCTRYTQDQVLEMAKYLREKDIPCDILGLEPGWQSASYSCSFAWDKGRYPNAPALLAELRGMGYHINLWEHAFTHPTSPIYDELLPHSGKYAVWSGLVPDFATKEAKDIFAKYHHDELVALGVDGFKLDECDSSDNTGGWSFPVHDTFPSGMDGEQYHSLFGTLYTQAIMQALDGAPTLAEVRNLGALAAPYPFVLYSDLYDHRDFVRGMTTASFAGLLWTPEVRHADSRKDMLRRLQSVVFSEQCLINAWYCDEAPWLQWGCEDEVRELLKLRQKLVPYLKAAFDEYAATGKPPVRALVMDYTDDAETYTIDDEYMFGNDLLVAPIIGTESDEREVYLPAGEWVDYFTGEPVTAGKFTVCTEGIPVYRKVK